MKISIVIPNWNGKKYLKECLDSLKKINYINYEVLIVDNGSSDDSVNFIKENYPDILYIANDKNFGFSVACNQGIKKALAEGAEAVLLLNNDTVVEENFLQKMVEVLQDEKVGIVGSKIYYYNNEKRIWYAGGNYIKWRSSGQHKYWMKMDRDSLRGVKETDFVTGCNMLIRKEVFDNNNFLFEPYFLTIEDLDFCISAKERDWKIKVNLDAKIWHKVSFSREGEFSFSNGYYGTRNRLFFAFKRKKNYLGGIILLIFVLPLRLIHWTFRGRSRMVYGIILGTRDYFLNKMGELKN